MAEVKELALDSSAVLRWLLQGQRWQVVDRLVQSDVVDLVLPGPVLTEVIAHAPVKGNVSTPTQLRTALTVAGMRVEPATADDLQEAGELLTMSRAHHQQHNDREHSLSLGDSLVLAVTARLGCPIVTSDRHWTWLADQGLLPVKIHQL